MAIKVHEFFSRYLQRSSIILTALSLVGALLAGGLAWLVWQELSFGPALTLGICMIGLIIINITLVLVALRLASRPLRIVTQAVAHVSNDPVVTPPPNVNNRRYERSGLKAVVQAVYELAVKSHKKSGEDSPQESAPQPADFFQTLANGLPCGIIAMDANGTITYANAAAPIKQMPNDTQEISLIFEQSDALATWLADCQANKVRDDRLWPRIANKVPGEEGRRIYDVIGHYQKNAQAGIEVLLVAFDRTEVYATDQEDMDFIALAAHELRGPITVIRGYLDVLAQELGEALTPDQHVLLERLQVSTERLSGYVNNILNVSRYDRHRLSINLHEESVANLLKSVLPDLTMRARTQRRKLVFKVPDGLPTVAADSTSLSEVITNLVDNAIKYSPEDGEIIVAATPKENFVEITVADHGIGIPPSIIGNLFNKFYRSHRSQHSIGGTGLGLYICKAIIESHGGSIWVNSQEGKGTTFGFTLPTYASVAQKLASGNNKDIIQRSEGWIKNHAMYRR